MTNKLLTTKKKKKERKKKKKKKIGGTNKNNTFSCGDADLHVALPNALCTTNSGWLAPFL